jgi:hypothetical protein
MRTRLLKTVLLAADERRWTRISDGKRFVFNLRSSAFIGG